MKTLLSIFALCCCTAFAQTTHTFAFGQFQANQYGTVTGYAPLQTLDGHDANQGIGYGGVIEVKYNETPSWGLQAPNGPFINPDGTYCLVGSLDVCSWGFPNNGDLLENVSTPNLSAPVFANPACTLKTAGCIFYETGTASFVGYGQGVVVSVKVWFVVNAKRHCGFGGCHTVYSYPETNGSGTATY